jgi:enoyl-CoA hydratase
MTRCVVLTGAGKAFAAGADIREMSQKNSKQAKAFARSGQQLFTFIENMPQVVIACLNGFALGGGCELACACDLRTAARNAKIGEPEVNLGIIPGFAGSIRLPRLIGLSYTMRMILTGEAVSAEEAQRIGLVHWVFDSHVLLEETLKIAARLAEKPPLAMAAAKKLLREGMDLPFAKAEKLEAARFADCFKTGDQKEGMRAFLEKRAPKFEGK